MQPTPEQAALLEQRFPTPQRKDFQSQQDYEEALHQQKMRWQQALRFAPTTPEQQAEQQDVATPEEVEAALRQRIAEDNPPPSGATVA